jgi:hypothetical protein
MITNTMSWMICTKKIYSQGGFVMLCILLISVNIWNGSKGIWRRILVVFMIGLSKYFDLILECNYFQYKILSSGIWCYFSLCDSWIKYGFIPIYGILGSAPTLLSITLYSLAKLMFVVKRQLYPFTNQTLYSMVLDVCFVLLFYFWQFPSTLL